MKFIKFFHDPGIGFPWMGAHGKAITFYLTRHRGFGIWLERQRYSRPTLRLGIWWVWDFDFHSHCA